jgi:mono/diheme cytochrome c family protein
MSDLLDAAAAALGVPAPLVQRAAGARATDTGMTVDEVLTAWAGGGAIEAPAPPPDAEEAPSPTEAPDQPPAAAPGTAVPAAATPTPAPAPATVGVVRSSMPSEVTPREAARLPEVITVPTAGIRERTNFTIPKWLTTLLLVAPLFALFALGGSATGECGRATELRTDVVTGEIVNCDGSEFTGQGPGDGGVDFVALGEQIYTGGAVAGVNCAGCHGAGGQGSASFPALSGVLTTFGACTDHLEWVALGSAGFRQAGRDTYGDTQKPVTQGMPSFASTLSPEQIAAVAAFERVRFGGGDRDQVGVDCGLVTPDEGDGDAPATTVPGA